MSAPAGRAALALVAGALGACGGGGGEGGGAEWKVLIQHDEASLMSVWGAHDGDVWIVGGDPEGRGGAVIRFKGQGFHRLDPGTPGDLWWVFGFPRGGVYIGGEHGTILRHDGDGFTRMATPSQDGTVFGIWGSSEDDIWAVGGNPAGSTGGFVWRYDGQAWYDVGELPGESAAAVFKVYGLAADDVWFVGANGKALRWDGQRLSAYGAGTSRTLLTVHGHADARPRFCAVGGSFSGTVVEGDAGGWGPVELPEATPQLNGVWVGKDAAWAVGLEGHVLKRQGGAWVQEITGQEGEASLHGVWRDPVGGVWAVGGDFLTQPLVDGMLLYRPPG